MQRAVLYARVSSEEQLDTWSIPAQKREFEDLCHQKGWQPVRFYSEEGFSARWDSIDRRPQLKRLLDDCRKREFDVVVVHSLDRWSRNLRVTLESFKHLAEQNTAFVSITENIDYSTPEGKLFIAMLGAFAQYFSDSLAKHTSKGIKERAMNGLHNGDVPFGYERCTTDCPAGEKGHWGKIHVVEKEAAAVRSIFELYAGGGWSLSSLAAWLNEQGFRTRNKHKMVGPDGQLISGPRPFTLYSVRWLLHNPFFTGRISYHGEVLDGIHQPIVDQRLFDKVQERLKNARGTGHTNSPRYRTYLLKGIVRCVHCGLPLWSEVCGRGEAYYRKQRDSGIHCASDGKAVKCTTIDGQMDRIIQSITLEPAWKQTILSKISDMSRVEYVMSERKRIEERLKRLGKAYVDGIVDDTDYTVQKILLQNALETLVIPEVDETMDAGELLDNVSEVWGKATLDERHRIVSTLLEAVYVDISSKSIVGLLPRQPFYGLFESLKKNPEAGLVILDPGDADLLERLTLRKEKALDLVCVPSQKCAGMVETGESRTPRPEEDTPNILQA